MADYGSFELVNSIFNPNKGSAVSSIMSANRAANGLNPSANITQGLLNTGSANNPATTSFLSKLGGINGNALAGIGTAVSAFQAYASFTQGKKAFKEQKKMNDLLQRQYGIENARYQERKAEQDKANKIIADSASVVDNSKNTIPNPKPKPKEQPLPFERQ
ncbi:hypothetical protein [Helicobacter mesocricetorum]|uniref:hypothetical protein n=1 Tax=Helicobacter mesocricetorum TaxID=87012 RepID=UPI000CF0A712|nr:hypothetical protein [Helicobacter mesocricetorum]